MRIVLLSLLLSVSVPAQAKDSWFGSKVRYVLGGGWYHEQVQKAKDNDLRFSMGQAMGKLNGLSEHERGALSGAVSDLYNMSQDLKQQELFTQCVTSGAQATYEHTPLKKHFENIEHEESLRRALTGLSIVYAHMPRIEPVNKVARSSLMRDKLEIIGELNGIANDIVEGLSAEDMALLKDELMQAINSNSQEAVEATLGKLSSEGKERVALLVRAGNALQIQVAEAQAIAQGITKKGVNDWLNSSAKYLGGCAHALQSGDLESYRVPRRPTTFDANKFMRPVEERNKALKRLAQRDKELRELHAEKCATAKAQLDAFGRFNVSDETILNNIGHWYRRESLKVHPDKTKGDGKNFHILTNVQKLLLELENKSISPGEYERDLRSIPKEVNPGEVKEWAEKRMLITRRYDSSLIDTVYEEPMAWLGDIIDADGIGPVTQEHN